MWRIAAVVAMCIAAAAFAGTCLSHLEAVRVGDVGADVGLWAATAAFVGTIVLVLFVEVLSVGSRLSRPAQQIRRAMQRVRAGDVGFRVPVGRGEPLAPLLHECNATLEWLNHNPPDGVRVDGDVFELAADDDGVDE